MNPRLMKQSILLPLLATLGLLLASCASEPELRLGQKPPAPRPMASQTAEIPQADTRPPVMPATAKEVRVGVLLPLTGDASALGNALLDAAMLGLFDKYNSMPPEQQPTKVVLLPKDTEGTAKGAALAAKSALEEGAKLFIGPLFADEVRAVTPLARKAGVSLLTFSNTPDVAGKGVYLFGFPAQQQVARVAGQAYAKELTRIGALVPANAYGELVASSLRAAAVRANQPLVGIEFFPPAANDVDVEIQKLLRSGPKGTRPEMDALLIAEGGDKLNHIINRLEVFGVSAKSTQLLGTGQWEDAALLANPKLSGGWFPGAPLVSSRNFEKRFESQYGYRAPRLASLAYDAVALAVTLAVISPTPTIDERLLTNPQGYVGPANGIFRLRADGQIERGLSVLQLTPRGVTELSPAPRAFYSSAE
jgi:ABC-type branched-subunit amino acid transport system substrate-binding protein